MLLKFVYLSCHSDKSYGSCNIIGDGVQLYAFFQALKTYDGKEEGVYVLYFITLGMAKMTARDHDN